MPTDLTDRALLEQDIEQTRARLAGTVAELSERMDVKARARQRLQSMPPAVPIALGAFVVSALAIVIWRRRS